MIVSMIIYDLNYSRIGEWRIHTCSWLGNGSQRQKRGVFIARNGDILHTE